MNDFAIIIGVFRCSKTLIWTQALYKKCNWLGKVFNQKNNNSFCRIVKSPTFHNMQFTNQCVGLMQIQLKNESL